jgi:hypothetical protein
MNQDPVERVALINPVPSCPPPPIDDVWRKLAIDGTPADRIDPLVPSRRARPRRWLNGNPATLPILAAAGVAVAVFVLALTLTGHGRHATEPTVATRPAQQQAPSAPPLVFMRRLQPIDQTYDQITILADGSGTAGHYIGEVAGVKNRGFRLTAATMSRLRRLIAAVPRARQGPVEGRTRTTVIYYLRADGVTLAEPQGAVPRQLEALVQLLNQILDRYW